MPPFRLSAPDLPEYDLICHEATRLQPESPSYFTALQLSLVYPGRRRHCRTTPPLAGRRATPTDRRSRAACLYAGLPSGSASGHPCRSSPTAPPTSAACMRDSVVVLDLCPFDNLPLFAANCVW